jgi:hypothetical protein
MRCGRFVADWQQTIEIPAKFSGVQLQFPAEQDAPAPLRQILRPCNAEATVWCGRLSMSTCHLSAATGHVGATRRRTLLASTALIAAALASPAVAETFWNSVAGNWATNANWTNNQPNATTDVTNVSNGEIAQIQTAAVAGTSFDMGARLKVNNGSTILLLPTGSLAFGGYADFNNGTLNLFSSTNVSGFIALTNSTISSNVDGTLTANISSVAGDNRIVAGNGTTLTLAPSLSFGVEGTSTLHFGATNNTGTVVYAGDSTCSPATPPRSSSMAAF